jgi:AcrR family transcriptional regulator
MLTMSTHGGILGGMPATHPRRPPATPPRKPIRKPASRYHHGDLRRALIDEAVRTIGGLGVEALTLREAGRRLGVSRTALYRHFSDKSALLAAVAREGFQRFREDLSAAWERAGRGRKGFAAMGHAYVRFAIANPSYYRVMFGQFSDLCAKDPGLQADASAAFRVLLDALSSLQEAGVVRPGDLNLMAEFVWATVHGVAMLAIDGQLGPDRAAPGALADFAIGQLRQSIGTA